MGKAKGSVVLSAVKLLRAQKEAGRKAVPPSLLRYLDERVVVAAWYPEEDLYALILACAATFPTQSDSVFDAMGAGTARLHLEGGVYGDLLKKDTAHRARVIWRAQHDTGDMAVTEETEKSATYELSGFDHATPKYCRVIGGYFAEVHRLTGARKPTHTHPLCRASGGHLCRYVISWS
jgi:hypothetical protein